MTPSVGDRPYVYGRLPVTTSYTTVLDSTEAGVEPAPAYVLLLEVVLVGDA